MTLLSDLIAPAADIAAAAVAAAAAAAASEAAASVSSAAAIAAAASTSMVVTELLTNFYKSQDIGLPRATTPITGTAIGDIDALGLFSSFIGSSPH